MKNLGIDYSYIKELSRLRVGNHVQAGYLPFLKKNSVP